MSDAKPEIRLVQTPEEIKMFVNSISHLATSPPSLYIDLEGVQLSRHGSLSIVTVFASVLNTVYLVDVHTLQAAAFNTIASNGTTFKQILQDQSIPKVFFDVRNDSDALFSHYGIKLAGIKDLQLMELATRSGHRKFVFGLAKCIQYDAAMPHNKQTAWQAVKDAGHKLFDPAKGGTYEVFNERPMKQEIAQYCAGDVVLLPKLYEKYDRALRLPTQGKWWPKKVDKATKRRVADSQSEGYQPFGRDKARGPW